MAAAASRQISCQGCVCLKPCCKRDHKAYWILQQLRQAAQHMQGVMLERTLLSGSHRDHASRQALRRCPSQLTHLRGDAARQVANTDCAHADRDPLLACGKLRQAADVRRGVVALRGHAEPLSQGLLLVEHLLLLLLQHALLSHLVLQARIRVCWP